MQRDLQHSFNRLEALKNDAQNHFKNFNEEQLNAAPAGKWGALQHMAHIISSESKGLGYMMKKIQAADEVGRAGIRENFNSLLLKAFLKTGIKFKAPAVLDVPKNRYSLQEVFTQWDQLRSQYVQFLESMDDATAHKLIYKHPIAGRLTPVQAMEFMAIHLGRHINAAKKNLK